MPDLLAHLEDVRPIVSTGRRGLFVDYDGAISEIAPTPDQAAVSVEAARSLEILSRYIETVCVVSGRAARDLQTKVGVKGIVYVGNHGAEYLINDEVEVVPEVAAYREDVKSVLGYLKARADLPGLVWDDKYYSASVHYRLAGDSEEARDRLAEALGTALEADGLEIFWGKMVLEIRAPIGVHKGYAVRKLAHEKKLESAIYIGDDTTDIDALRTLTELRGEGRLTGFGVAVRHDDTPEELVRLADFSLDSVSGVETFLSWLVKAVAVPRDQPS